MANYNASIGEDRLVYDRVDAGVLPFSGTSSFWTPDLYDRVGFLNGTLTDNAFPAWPTANHNATRAHAYGEDWFNRIHLIPTKFDLGNILSTQIKVVEIYNAFLLGVSKDLTAFVNNVGAGTTVTNLPSLPATIDGQSSLLLNIQVSTIGSPTLAGTLDFTAGGALLVLTLIGRRVILVPVRPQSPVIETLEFLSDVIISRDDSEQRIALRDGPRQIIQLDFFDIEAEAANLRSLLFDWLPRVWGVPSWWEERSLDADAAQDSDTIQLDTSYMDLRVGGLGAVYTDQFDYEALEIDSFDGSSITFTTPLQRDHSAAVSTFIPVRICYADQNPRGSQLRNGQQRLTMQFTTIETVDLASAAAFSTYDSKVILDEGNLVPGGGQHTQAWQRKTDRIESKAGRLRLLELSDRSRIQMIKGFHINSAQRLWEVRQLFHYLKGQVTAFYLPTFRYDLPVTQGISAGGTGVTIRNIGFTDFVGQRQPFAHCQITLKDGTVATRQITGSSVIDLDEESLTIDSQFSASAIAVEDIAHLALVVLVRNSDDKLVFEHRLPGYGFATMNVISTKA